MIRPGLMQTEEAARALGLEPATLEKWARLGIVKPVVSIDDLMWWDPTEVRDQVQRIRRESP
ncbi:hypothetical protein AD006_12370 [Pseudonocardia sp. EC080610-09]|nr:hypothetical protein FRP1_04725 [Pseudonocardia sp. EC080625-04]ALL75901.1 hypothetical protein AD006_12370 [Pseudonocardia sp. EC080610-09]ALL82928.1 hypothetical protein AD017_20200 [Pseudonocardia sp. EC080619-01]